MLSEPQRRAIINCLNDNLGRPCVVEGWEIATGGDINASYHLITECGRYFVKTHGGSSANAMYQAERSALQALGQQTQLKVPQPIALGQGPGQHFLVMEGLQLGARADGSALGKGLAQLHRLTADRYGFAEDNFIGTTPQTNTWSNHWTEFWWHCRLLPQLTLAYHNGYRGPLQPLESSLALATEELLKQHQPPPALVHGDLWGGNVGFEHPGSAPCVFDPASYYGDREVDMAMTRLFGGFSEAFYSAYHQHWPLPPGHQQRVPLYNLYHLLNHLNLFGRGYLAQCLNEINRLI